MTGVAWSSFEHGPPTLPPTPDFLLCERDRLTLRRSEDVDDLVLDSHVATSPRLFEVLYMQWSKPSDDQ